MRSPQRLRIDGHVRPGFEAVRDAFAENFSRRHELGGAGVGYAYVTSQMGTALTGDPRELALRNAVYAVI